MEVNSISANVMYTNMTSLLKQAQSTRTEASGKNENADERSITNEKFRRSSDELSITNEKFRSSADELSITGEKFRGSSDNLLGSSVDIYI